MDKRFVTYKNGNYRVMIDLKTGTKIRENNLDFFRADFPESMDIKICNKCDMGCPMCHENSTPDGEGTVLSASVLSQKVKVRLDSRDSAETYSCEDVRVVRINRKNDRNEAERTEKQEKPEEEKNQYLKFLYSVLK